MLLTVGVAIMIVVSRINYIRMIFPSMVLSVAAVVVLALTLFLGNTINDAQRSISIFGIPVHASELAKIAVVFTLSYILALFIDKREGTVKDKGLYWCAGIVTMFGGLLLMQGMTNTILFMAISFALLIIGGTKTSKLVKIVGVYLLVGLAFLMIKGWIESRSLADLKEEDKQTQVEEKGALRNDTWSARIDRYAERFYGPPLYKLPIVTAGEDKNDQEMYSYMAQANGGIIGKIPGNSRETSRLPLANTDYVFSIIVEDTGRKHCQKMFAGLSCVFGDGHGCDGFAASLFPHGHYHRSVSRFGTTASAHIERRNVDLDYVFGIRGDVERQPFGSADECGERDK